MSSTYIVCRDPLYITDLTYQRKYFQVWVFNTTYPYALTYIDALEH